MENSTLTTHKVFVYPGILTWNEGLQTCQHYNQEMMDIDHDDMYSAVQSLITAYPAVSVCVVLYEPRREKTGFLHMRKQKRRSASR